MSLVCLSFASISQLHYKMSLTHGIHIYKITMRSLEVLIAVSETSLRSWESHLMSLILIPRKTEKEICPKLQYSYREKYLCRIRQLQSLSEIPLWDKLMKSKTFEKRIKYMYNDPDFYLYHLGSFNLWLLHCSWLNKLIS